MEYRCGWSHGMVRGSRTTSSPSARCSIGVRLGLSYPWSRLLKRPGLWMLTGAPGRRLWWVIDAQLAVSG